MSGARVLYLMLEHRFYKKYVIPCQSAIVSSLELVKLVKGAAGKQKIEFEELVRVVVGLGERPLFGHNELKSDAVAT
jgi:hypothetical protein